MTQIGKPHAKPVIRPDFGSYCEFDHRAIKRRSWKTHSVTWERSNAHGLEEGVYIGYRTVYSGLIEWENGEEGYRYFVPKAHCEVWLFVIDEHTNPVHVFPEDVK